MRAPRQQCPKCEHPRQIFRPRSRDIGNGVIEVYISCTMCPYKRVLRRSTKEIESLMVKKTRYQEQARREIARYGESAGTTNRAVEHIDGRIAAAMKAMAA